MSFEEEIPVKTFQDGKLVKTEIVKRTVELDAEQEQSKDHEARLNYLEEFVGEQGEGFKGFQNHGERIAALEKVVEDLTTRINYIEDYLSQPKLGVFIRLKNAIVGSETHET